jgi:hypothetical protein
MTNDPITLPPLNDIEEEIYGRTRRFLDDDVRRAMAELLNSYARAAVLADRAAREGPALPGPEGPTIPADEGPDDDQRKGGPPEVTRAMLLAGEYEQVERLRALLREAREHVEATLVDMATPADRELLARIDAALLEGK